MRMKKIMFILVLALTLPGFVNANDQAGKSFKYYLLIGTPEPAVLQQALKTPADFGVPAVAELESMGGKLIGYYFAVEHAKNYALMALPDSSDMAALVYQRMATGAMRDIEVIELIPSDEMVSVFKKAYSINNE